MCSIDITQKKQFEQLVEHMEDVCRDVSDKLPSPPKADGKDEETD